MSVLSFVQYQYFKSFSKLVRQNRYHAVECQEKILATHIAKAKNTIFGKEHHFENIRSYEDFCKHVPVRSYEDFESYFNRIFSGEPNVLWNGIPSYFAKSSGTSGNPKLLPVTNEFLTATQFAARYMLCNLAQQLQHTKFIGEKIFYLTDQQNFEDVNGFPCAAISAIKSHKMPGWAKRFSIPSKEINDITDPHQKIAYTVQSLLGNDIRMAVALPVYLAHFLKEFEQENEKKFRELFPQFSVLFLSGMNYELYENFLRNHLGQEILIMENYSATEGNFAYQVVPGTKGMELICNQGIFYEFIPLEEIDKNNPTRLPLSQVQTGRQYALVISNNSGLWAYNMNDIVEFISIDPYRLVVSGRLKDIFSPFGEHMLPIQAEQAIAAACSETNNVIFDFVIIPDFEHSTYRYTCYAVFENEINDTEIFSVVLHHKLCACNSYYDDLSKTGAISIPAIKIIDRDFFENIFSARSKLSAQQKIKHLVTDNAVINMLKNLL